MNESKNKLFLLALGIIIFNIGVVVAFKFVVDKAADKAADRVIRELQRGYSPSPYGPGFDPDKVSPDGFKANKAHLDNRKTDKAEPTVITNLIIESDAWRDGWERTRGFSYEQ